MTWLTALLPVNDGVAGRPPSPRVSTAPARPATQEQGTRHGGLPLASVLGQPSTTPTTTGAVPVRLGLVMSDSALLGTSDQPAHPHNYGPIPAERAREIVAAAPTEDEQAGSAGSTPVPPPASSSPRTRTTDSSRPRSAASSGSATALRRRGATPRTPTLTIPMTRPGAATALATPRASARPATTPNSPCMAGSTCTGRHREPRHRDHAPDRSRLPVPSTRHRHGAASDGTGPAHRLRPRGLTCVHLAWWEVD